MRRILRALITAASLTVITTACNTVRGVGADVESVAAAFDPAYTYRACGSYGPIDRNGDGRISNSEWNAYHAGAYRGWDLNGDGRISRREYAQCWYGGGFYPTYQKAAYEPSWVAFDANGDLLDRAISVFQIRRDARYSADDMVRQYHYIGAAPQS